MWHTQGMITRRLSLAGLFAVASVGQTEAAGSFASFVAGVKAEARRAGIREATINAAFAGVEPNARVIELDRKQPEFNLTWPEYKSRVLPPSRLQAAREKYGQERPLLKRINARYGVDPFVMVGIWGIESNFGANKGTYRLVEALSTLAWDGRRSSYFRKELLNALRILNAGDVPPVRLTGGWAGAMGQPQFMPSSFLSYAVDFDGDGKRDIWDSKPDVFGSMANYLARHGWKRGEPWGQPIAVPAHFNMSQAGRGNRKSLGAWMDEGVRHLDGSRFSRSDPMGAVVIPSGAPPGEAYMVYANFDVLRRYNPSDFYALAVGLLGDAAA